MSEGVGLLGLVEVGVDDCGRRQVGHDDLGLLEGRGASSQDWF